MKLYLLLVFALLLKINVNSQNTNLSDYSYVVVPEQFEFLNEKDKFQLNSMSKFYFEKSGFNAYMSDSVPNFNRCEGLYANVEELKSLFGTKLQVVLKDCNNEEIYRGQEGKSKYKEYDKTYQDALRKAFNSIEMLNVDQKDVRIVTNHNNPVVSKEANKRPAMEAVVKPNVSRVSGNLLPDSKFSNYTNAGKIYLLRKTADGYSLYEETTATGDGLLLKGKIVVMDKVVRYMDASGKVSDAAFDASGNLTIQNDASVTIFLLAD